MPRYKKKTHLHYEKRGTKRSIRDTPDKRLKRICGTNSPEKSLKRKRQTLTPLSSAKRSLHLLFSPQKENNLTVNFKSPISSTIKLIYTALDTTILSPCKIQTASARSETKTKKKLRFRNTEKKNEQNINQQASEVNEAINLLDKLVQNGNFSNITFQLLLDSLRWHASDNTSSMRYSEGTKEFFWTGKRLLGGQFLRFMRGFAHQGAVKHGASAKGIYEPSTSQINLPVPSDTALAEFTPTGICLEENLKPGILKENINMSANAMPNTSHIVMFDGKKITPNSADVYLLGQEEEPKLANIEEENRTKIHTLEEILKSTDVIIEQGVNLVFEIEPQASTILLGQAKEAIRVIGTVTKSLRECYCKKALYLESIQKKLLETNEEKLKFASNRIKTLMYKMKICIGDLIEVVDVLCQLCAEINGSLARFRKESCDITEHDAYRELKSPEELRRILNTDKIPDAYLKQRTAEWFALRKEVKVTGSIAGRAIGLETLAAQKQHFEFVFCDAARLEPNEQQKRAMEHGSTNELNAIATVIGKVMPAYFPEHIFYEEGAYTIRNDKGEPIMVVSPDGSLKSDKSIVSVEIKCPFSSYTGMTPVYYDVKPRHVVQCQLEAHVQHANEHLYISWSKDTTSVFKMRPDADLVHSVIDEVQSTYYGDYPTIPTKVSELAKELKKSIEKESRNAEFLGEFPSLIARCSTRSKTSTTERNVYHEQGQCTGNLVEGLCVEKVVQYLHKGIKQLSEAFTFQKQMASEVLVYLMSDMDRSWNREVGHGLPIAYLFKGYSLTMGTSRRILEEVLDACHKAGAHVPCVTFDGQFSRLKDYDDMENPLTLFALQRKFWTEVNKNTKRQLINHVRELFKTPDWYLFTDAMVSTDETLVIGRSYFVVQNRDCRCLPIVTSLSRVKLKSKTATNEDDTTSTFDVIDSAGLDDDVVTIVEDVTASTRSQLASEVQEAAAKGENHSMSTPAIPTATSSEHAHESFVQFEHTDYVYIHRMLQDSKRKKWEAAIVEEVMGAFGSAEKMDKAFTGQELTLIVKYLNLKSKGSKSSIQQSLRKSEKINAICKFLGNSTSVPVPTKRKRSKGIASLQSLCIMELQKKSYPKEALALSYAESYWPCYKDKWYENSTGDEEVKIEFHDRNDKQIDQVWFKPVYFPEYSPNRNQLEVRVMDGTHIRTNIKSKLIRNGLGNIKIEPWKEIAMSGATEMAPAMLEVQQDGKIMHQQSDPFVRTMFSEEVEHELLKN